MVTNSVLQRILKDTSKEWRNKIQSSNLHSLTKRTPSTGIKMDLKDEVSHLFSKHPPHKILTDQLGGSIRVPQDTLIMSPGYSAHEVRRMVQDWSRNYRSLVSLKPIILSNSSFFGYQERTPSVPSLPDTAIRLFVRGISES